MLLFLFSLFISTFLPLFSLENLERPLTTQAEYVAALDELQSFRGSRIDQDDYNFDTLMREWGVDRGGRYIRHDKMRSSFEEHPGIARLYATYDLKAARRIAQAIRGERLTNSEEKSSIRRFLLAYSDDDYSTIRGPFKGGGEVSTRQMRSDTTAQSIIFGKTVGGLLLRAVIVLSIANWLKSRDKSIPALMFKKVQSYISSVRAYFKEKYRNPSSMVKEVSASVWKAAKKYKWITIPLVIWFMLQAVQLVQHGTLSPYNKSAENDNSLLGVPHLRDVANAPYTLAEGVERGLSYPLFYDPDALLRWNALQQKSPEAVNQLATVRTGKTFDWLVGYKDPVSEEPLPQDITTDQHQEAARKIQRAALRAQVIGAARGYRYLLGYDEVDLSTKDPESYKGLAPALKKDIDEFLSKKRKKYDFHMRENFFYAFDKAKHSEELGQELHQLADELFREKYKAYFLKRAEAERRAMPFEEFNRRAPGARSALRRGVQRRRERKERVAERQRQEFEGLSDFRDHILGIQQRAGAELERQKAEIRGLEQELLNRVASIKARHEEKVREIEQEANRSRVPEYDQFTGLTYMRVPRRVIERLRAEERRSVDAANREIDRVKRELEQKAQPHANIVNNVLNIQKRRLLHDLEEYGLPAHRFECCSASDSLDDRVLCASCYKSTITEKPHCPFCRVLLTPELVHGFTPHRHKQEQCAICGDHIVAPRRSADAVDTEEVDDLEEGEGIPIPEPEVDVDEMD